MNTNFGILNLIFGSLFAAQALFVVVTRWIVIPSEQNRIGYSILLVSGLLLAASFFVFRQLLSKIAATAPPPQKWNQYRTANIIRWALHEGATMATLAIYFVSGLSILWYAGVLLAGLFLLTRPTRERIIADLQLNPIEAALLDQTTEFK